MMISFSWMAGVCGSRAISIDRLFCASAMTCKDWELLEKHSAIIAALGSWSNIFKWCLCSIVVVVVVVVVFLGRWQTVFLFGGDLDKVATKVGAFSSVEGNHDWEYRTRQFFGALAPKRKDLYNCFIHPLFAEVDCILTNASGLKTYHHTNSITSILNPSSNAEFKCWEFFICCWAL